ncbi:hypothetical protein [Thalassospira xiamenensis]|uniref:hypothetical protein n=1 Tax=Thalassospira xiamenensis TaxID=220697 RepID=UPI000DF8E03A|nr:hypothetical protein [Thalassospira xiamenensis]RCK34890.1 hypothetical protein TH24_20060 [Thalassospira xiamenensis]
MNINTSFECESCGTITNCRIGMSNRAEQPLAFCCQECGQRIDIVIGGKHAGITGAIELKAQVPFDDETNFVDLHLDFPVYFGKYVMGHTPYLRAVERIGPENIQRHSARLSHLDACYTKFSYFETLLKFYTREKWVPFKNAIEKKFSGVVISDKMQDRNAALYKTIAEIMWPFAMPGQASNDIERYMGVQLYLAESHRPAFHAFVDEILETKFLKNLQVACLGIYPRILKAELPLRPALFLDFDAAYQKQTIPMRVSADQFDDFKDLYKDIAEIISRQFVLVAGLNNLLKRGDHNVFKPEIGMTKSGKDQTPKSLHAFTDIPFGLKSDFIDDNWFSFGEQAADNQLRNAIAHFKTDYDDITQKITYYPRKEGMKQEKSEVIYFLDFMQRVLIAYREMNRLHQLIKSLFYYHYLMQAAKNAG